MKTRLYTRKRALISSVAMLLVAMIALGTATFAWFTRSTTATAKNITAGTTKASSLVISKLDKEWGTTVDYGISSQVTFIPTSSANLATWYTADAQQGDKFDRAFAEGSTTAYAEATNVTTKVINNSQPVTTASTTENYAFVNQLNVKNAGAEDIANVEIKLNWTESAAVSNMNYLRFAIVEVTDTEDNKGTNATLVDTTSLTPTIYATEAKTYKPLSSTTTEGTQVTASALAQNGVATTITELKVGQAKYFQIYFWFEGQDSECTTVNSGNSMPNVTFTVAPKAT